MNNVLEKITEHSTDAEIEQILAESNAQIQQETLEELKCLKIGDKVYFNKRNSKGGENAILCTGKIESINWDSSKPVGVKEMRPAFKHHRKHHQLSINDMLFRANI